MDSANNLGILERIVARCAQRNYVIPRNELHFHEIIGEGAEATVKRGKWQHSDVAIKEMHPNSPAFGLLCPWHSEVLAGVVREVAALIDLWQHPNILRFVGVCLEPPCIITELCRMGSLFSMLKEARQGNQRTRKKLTWMQRLVMLQDIAAGMAYLHSRSYVHGDLRSPNVFVTEDQRLKIGDFGFARILSGAQDGTPVPARLTNPRWQAPEVYKMEPPQATTAADVYSFGIIMYEVLTFNQPYDDVRDDRHVANRIMMQPLWRPQVPERRKLPIPTNTHLQAYISLMADCWVVDPERRPSFSRVSDRLMALIRWRRVQTLARVCVKLRSEPRATAPALASSATGVARSRATAASEEALTPQCVRRTNVSAHGMFSAAAEAFAAAVMPWIFLRPMPLGAQGSSFRSAFSVVDRHYLDDDQFSMPVLPAPPPSGTPGMRPAVTLPTPPRPATAPPLQPRPRSVHTTIAGNLEPSDTSDRSIASLQESGSVTVPATLAPRRLLYCFDSADISFAVAAGSATGLSSRRADTASLLMPLSSTANHISMPTPFKAVDEVVDALED